MKQVINDTLRRALRPAPAVPAEPYQERSINEGTSIGLTGPTIFGFLRIATNPRVLESPLPVDTAISYVTGWLEQPSVEFIVPGRDTWRSPSGC